MNIHSLRKGITMGNQGETDIGTLRDTALAALETAKDENRFRLITRDNNWGVAFLMFRGVEEAQALETYINAAAAVLPYSTEENPVARLFWGRVSKTQPDDLAYIPVNPKGLMPGDVEYCLSDDGHFPPDVEAAKDHVRKWAGKDAKDLLLHVSGSNEMTFNREAGALAVQRFFADTGLTGLEDYTRPAGAEPLSSRQIFDSFFAELFPGVTPECSFPLMDEIYIQTYEREGSADSIAHADMMRRITDDLLMHQIEAHCPEV